MAANQCGFEGLRTLVISKNPHRAYMNQILGTVEGQHNFLQSDVFFVFSQAMVRNRYVDWRSSTEHYYKLAVWNSSDDSCLVCLMASVNECEHSLLHVVELSIS